MPYLSDIKGFNNNLKFIKKDFKSLDVVMDYTSVDKDMIKTLKENTWGQFSQFGLQSQEQLVDVMYNSILGKTTYATMVGQIRTDCGFCTSSVNAKSAQGYCCPAYDQGGNCGDCRACWDSNIDNVDYKLH